MDAGIIGFIVFILVLSIVVYLKKDKIERQGIILMLRTKKFKQDIKKHAIKHRKFWNTYFNIGICVSFLAMFFGIWYLINNTITIASGIGIKSFAIVLPFPTSSFSFHHGLFLVPIWYWLIAIIILIFPHELSHAFALSINKLRIKSLGLILFLFIPGAFVEPDEKQLKKASKFKRLQVFCAGSFSNIVTALFFILILNVFLSVAYTPAGIYYSFPTEKINKTDIIEINNLTNGMIELKTENNSYLLTNALLKEQKNKTEILVFQDWPAARNNLSGTIKKIDNYWINTPKDVSFILSKHKPNDTILIETTKGIYNITLAENNGEPFLGIVTSYDPILDLIAPMNYRAYEIKNNNFEKIGEFLLQLIVFIIAVCFGVAIVNILPIKPLDGGLVLETLTNKKIANFISLIIFILIIYNFVGPFL